MTKAADGKALKQLLADIETAKTISDTGKAIERFSDRASCRILHLGVCKIDDVLVRDIVYTGVDPVSGIAPADFSEETKSAVVLEALHLMRPFDLASHVFEKASGPLIENAQSRLRDAGVRGVWVIPYTHGQTISIVIGLCPPDRFEEKQAEMLPGIYNLVAKLFTRFPALGRWPGQFRLTQREAQVLQLSAEGQSEAEIAALLNISPNTVRNHIENAKRKLDARNKAHAIALAASGGEINPLTDEPRKDGW